MQILVLYHYYIARTISWSCVPYGVDESLQPRHTEAEIFSWFDFLSLSDKKVQRQGSWSSLTFDHATIFQVTWDHDQWWRPQISTTYGLKGIAINDVFQTINRS